MSTEKVRDLGEYKHLNGREPIVHNLDVLRPRPEYVELAGRRFDLSRIPSGIALEIVAEWESFQEDAQQLTANSAGPKAAETLEKALRLVVRLLRRPFSLRHFDEWWQTRGVTRRWLIRHTDIVQLRRFIDLTVRLLFKSLNAGADEEGNASPPQ